MGHAQLFLLPQVLCHRKYSLSPIQSSIMVKYFHWHTVVCSYVKCLSFSSDFNQKRNMSTNYGGNCQTRNLMKSHQLGMARIRAHRRMEMKRIITPFGNSCAKAPNKRLVSVNVSRFIQKRKLTHFPKDHVVSRRRFVVKHNLITEVYLMTVMETTTCFGLYWPSSGCLGKLRASYMHARARGVEISTYA